MLNPKGRLSTVSLFPMVAIIFAATAINAQTPGPTPPESSGQDVVKISTTLVQVDATVTDQKGRIVSDLRPEDFEVYQNGKKQTLTAFSFVSSVSERAVAARERRGKDAIPEPPAVIRPESVKRSIALVVDDLTLSFESVYQVRRALKKFVDEQMQDGDLVAIIRTSGGLGALQQFTNDKRQLYAAIEKVKWNLLGSGGVSAFAPIEATPLETAAANGATISQEMLDSEADFIRNSNQFRANLFASGTLGAINFILNGMAELPGRKSIMLLSDGFRLFDTGKDEFRDTNADIAMRMRRLVDLANRASVVIHTIDARGLQALGFTAADNTAFLSQGAISQRFRDRSDELFETQEGLSVLARETGGTSILNSNDLVKGIRKLLDDQSYYLIGYEPDEDTFDRRDSRFNKLEIKVTRPGLKVRYRSGFFGFSDEPDRTGMPVAATERSLSSALTSPFAISEIELRMNALFGSDAGVGPYIRTFLHIDGADLQFSEADSGKRTATFDILAVVFGDNGVPADQLSKTYTMTVSEATYKEIIDTGFVYDLVFPMKRPGPYQLRLALRDRATEKLGTANQFVEVPNLKKKKLVLSGIGLESVSFEDWSRNSGGKAGSDANMRSNPVSDTALRRFTRGNVLNYGGKVFNLQRNSGPANVTYKTRVFRDGKLEFEGKPQPVSVTGQARNPQVEFLGSLNLGNAMELGEYVLQIVLIEQISAKKRNISTQFVQFELVDPVAVKPGS